MAYQIQAGKLLEAYFLTSTILDAKHENIIGNNQVFLCFYAKDSSYSRQKLSEVNSNKILVFPDNFLIFSIQDY